MYLRAASLSKCLVHARMNQSVDGSSFSQQTRLSHLDGVDLAEIADRYGTPCYVYSADQARARYEELDRALSGVEHSICYAVKANSSLGILQVFAQLGAGFDIVSGGELLRVIEAGGDVSKVVFSGVGKRTDEIDFALKSKIGCFNVESAAELNRIESRASLLGLRAPISLRVNPEVDAKTHPYISTGLRENKFGVPVSQAKELYHQANNSAALSVIGIDCHIGSQITELGPFSEALAKLLELIDEFSAAGINIQHVDLGGGLGVEYDGTPGMNPAAYGKAIAQGMEGRDLHFLLEPGRFMVANAGVLLTRVEYLKPAPAPGYKDFAVVDAAMNDLIRPALYQAHHNVVPVDEPDTNALIASWNLVGPVCESGYFLAHNRSLALSEGSLLAVCSAGAYGMVQASNYNSRTRAAEVLIDKGAHYAIRHRETMADLLGPERAALALQHDNTTRTPEAES